MLTFSQLGKWGRLGNQMFQIASTIGIATKNYSYYGFPKWEYQEYFKNPLPVFTEELPRLEIPWGYHDIIEDNVDLHGYLQSEKYFEHCKGLVRHYFKFKDTLQMPENSVSLHVRRGDYDDNCHPLLGMEYYEKALKLVSGTVYIFSDDIEEAEKMLGSSFIYVKGNDPIKELQMMSLCKQHIIANSSFSWWGAWLGGGKTIAPKRWFGENYLNPKDIYTKNMICL